VVLVNFNRLNVVNFCTAYHRIAKHVQERPPPDRWPPQEQQQLGGLLTEMNRVLAEHAEEVGAPNIGAACETRGMAQGRQQVAAAGLHKCGYGSTVFGQHDSLPTNRNPHPPPPPVAGLTLWSMSKLTRVPQQHSDQLWGSLQAELVRRMAGTTRDAYLAGACVRAPPDRQLAQLYFKQAFSSSVWLQQKIFSLSQHTAPPSRQLWPPPSCADCPLCSSSLPPSHPAPARHRLPRACRQPPAVWRPRAFQHYLQCCLHGAAPRLRHAARSGAGGGVGGRRLPTAGGWGGMQGRAGAAGWSGGVGQSALTIGLALGRGLPACLPAAFTGPFPRDILPVPACRAWPTLCVASFLTPRPLPRPLPATAGQARGEAPG